VLPPDFVKIRYFFDALRAVFNRQVGASKHFSGFKKNLHWRAFVKYGKPVKSAEQGIGKQ